MKDCQKKALTITLAACKKALSSIDLPWSTIECLDSGESEDLEAAYDALSNLVSGIEHKLSKEKVS